MDIAQKLQQTAHPPIDWGRVRRQLLAGVVVSLVLLLVVSKFTSGPKAEEVAVQQDSTLATAGPETAEDNVVPPAASSVPPPMAEPPAERFIVARAGGGASAAKMADFVAIDALVSSSAGAWEQPEPAHTAPAVWPALATAADDHAQILLAESLAIPEPPAPTTPESTEARPVAALATPTAVPDTAVEPEPAAELAAAAEAPMLPVAPPISPSGLTPDAVVAALTPATPSAPPKDEDSLSFDDLLNLSSPDSHTEPQWLAAATETPTPPTDSVVVEVKSDGSVVQGEPQSQEDLVKEMKQLQEKFDQLQETVNIVVTQMMSDVETENAQLRAEVKRLQARDQAGLLASNAVPKPGGELLNQLSQEARDTPPEELEKDPLPPAAFAFNVMKEWGRDPEAAKQLGGKVVTLKGVIGTVPLGSTREDIEQLGRDLRAQYAEYDNINVEIFDDPVAAQAFVDSQTVDPDHHVLSVSKYSATNHDAITFYDGGEATDLLPQIPSAIAQELPLAPADNSVTQDPPQEVPEASVAQDAPEAAPVPAPAQNDSPKSIHNKKGRRPGK